MTPKVLNEHSAGKNLTDVLLHGVDAQLTLADAGALSDVRQYLTGPDIQPSKWLDGNLRFADNDAKFIMVYRPTSSSVRVNAEQVDPKQFTSWKDLLDPKWKDKIIMGDPSSPGAALGMAWYWYVTPANFMGDSAFGMIGTDFETAVRNGIPILTLGVEQLRDGG